MRVFILPVGRGGETSVANNQQSKLFLKLLHTIDMSLVMVFMAQLIFNIFHTCMNSMNPTRMAKSNSDLSLMK